MAQTLAAQIAIKIVDHAKENSFPVGTHLKAQYFADLFQVSRIPVTTALKQLAAEGLAISLHNRGFFLAKDAAGLPEHVVTDDEALTPWADPLYYRLAEDWLSGRISERASENELMRFYTVSRPRLIKVLQRAAEDLWVEKLPGRGWRFQSMMVSQRAYEDGYRLRMVVEPAALLEPGFTLDREALQTQAEQQIALLKGEFRRLSQAELFSINSQFHEVLTGFSGNTFFVDAVKKIDRVRRLLEFRCTTLSNRERLLKQCSEHLEIIDLLEKGDRHTAAERLRDHIHSALESKITLVAGCAIA